MPEQTWTCQWCNQQAPALVVVTKPVPDTERIDGPFRVCVARCGALAEHFGYDVLERMGATQ
jgi:hypothetical protein